MDEKMQAITEIQKEMEEEFPYLRHMEVEKNVEHPMLQVEQPTSAASPVCLLVQAFPSTQLENKENVECPVPHEEKPKEIVRSPVFPVNYPFSNTQVEVKKNAECPVNQADQPMESARSPACLDKQALPSVNKHHYTKATEGTTSCRAQEEWVVVLPQKQTKAPKKSVNAPHCQVVDDTRRKEYINKEQHRRQEKEYENEFLENLEAAFLSRTTGCPDSAPAPERFFPQQIRKALKKSVKASYCSVVPVSTTPRWKGSKFKQHVGNSTRNWCKAYGKTNTKSCLDRCWSLSSGRAWRPSR